MIPRDPYLTINEAAIMRSVSRRTIYNWIRKGLVEIKRTPSGKIRISKQSLELREDNNVYERSN